jgi:soluble lytic murein transglycosylase-like protein
MLREVLASRELTPELLAVVLVESGFRNGVRPDPQGSRGVGLWQFIPSTARRYGLTVEDMDDERLEPRRATEAAAALLADLRAQMGDWPLAFAAYYEGRATVEKAIAKGGTRDAAELQRRGLLETYPSKVLAAVVLLRDPSLAD